MFGSFGLLHDKNELQLDHFLLDIPARCAYYKDDIRYYSADMPVYGAGVMVLVPDIF